MNKVLILTVTAGEGHNSVGKAINSKLAEMGVETKTIDVFKNYSKFCYHILDDGYLFFSRHAPLMLDGPFHATKNQGVEHKNKGGSLLPVWMVRKKVFKDIANFNPDVIVCTHPLAPRIPIDMKEYYDGVPKIVSIVTDYTSHPVWEKVSDSDYIVTASDEFDPIFYHKGYKPEQILHFGIPVKDIFSKPHDKKELRKKLGLEDKTTIMIMYGGNSVGKPSDFIKDLDEIDGDFQVIFVAGKSKDEKKRVDRLIAKGLSKKVLCYGFVNNVDELMGASDFLIGKVGAATINECLNSKLPLIVVGRAFMQEADNLHFLLRHKAALHILKKKDFAEEMEKILKTPSLLEEVKIGIDKLRQPNAANDITEFVAKLAIEETCPIIKLPRKRKKTKAQKED